MGVVKISTLVHGKALGIYNLMRRVERFPEFMPQIKKIKILDQLTANRQLSEWEVDIEGTTIGWREEEIYNDEDRTFSFRMVEGDFKAFEGRWTIGEISPSKTRVTVEATFDWGLTNLGKHVEPVLARKAKTNLTRMVAALRRYMRTRKPIHG